MRKLEHFWTALESVPTLTQPIRLWEEMLGPDFDFGLQFLRSTGRLAEWMPCPTPGRLSCGRRVLAAGDGGLLAVCGNEPKECDTTAVERQSLVLHQFRVERLARRVSQALGIETAVEEHPHIAGVWILGRKRGPAAGEQVIVCLVIPDRWELLRNVVVEVLTEVDGPTIMVTPTANGHTFRTRQLIEGRGGVLAALDELLELDGGTFVAVAPLAQPLARGSEGMSTPLKRNVIRKRGQHWELEFEGTPVLLTAPNGPLYIVHLLIRPYEWLPATELLRIKSRLADLPSLGSAGKATDKKALKQYRDRLRFIEDELAPARAEGDSRRIKALTKEQRLLNAHLASVTGLGGRIRTVAEDLERMRKSVAGAIDRTCTAIDEAEHPLLAHHLRTFIHKGRQLSYQPTPLLRWQQE